MYKHPNLRVGYVSQHATHHIGMVLSFRAVRYKPVLVERHLEKTPIGYIQWRFQDGHDREYFPEPAGLKSDLNMLQANSWKR